MFSFPAVAQLQVHGIKTLAFLAPTTSVQQRLVEFGAVEVALTVMHSFPELLDVQLNGCRVRATGPPPLIHISTAAFVLLRA